MNTPPQNTLYTLLSVSIVIIFVISIYLIFPIQQLFKNENNIAVIHFADNITKAHEAIIEQFNEKYRNSIKVIPINLPFEKFSTNERKQLLTRAFRSKSTNIDIFSIDLIWAPRFHKWCEPLNKHFSAQERAGFLNSAMKACEYQNKLIGVPLFIDMGIMHYRRDLLQQFPDFENLEKKLKESITWEEFIKLSQERPEKGSPFYLFPADNYEGLICSFVEVLVGQNANLLVSGEINLMTPEAKKGLQLLVNLIGKYKMTPEVVTEFREEDVYQYALAQDAMFFRGWIEELNRYADKYKDKLENLHICSLPHWRDGKPVAVYGGWDLMVSKYSKNKEAAIKFLKFATSMEMQKVIYETTRQLPVMKGVYYDSDFVEKHPELLYYKNLLEQGIHRPIIPEYTKISDIISYYVKMAIKKKLTVEEALAQATRQINSNKTVIN